VVEDVIVIVRSGSGVTPVEYRRERFADGGGGGGGE